MALVERSKFGLNELLGVHSAAINDLADLPILERKLRLTLQVKDGSGSRSIRYVSGELATVSNISNGRVCVERQLGDALLALREQRLRFLSEFCELVDAICCVGELSTRIVLKANIRRQECKHAANVERVVGDQVAVDQLFFV